MFFTRRHKCASTYGKGVRQDVGNAEIFSYDAMATYYLITVPFWEWMHYGHYFIYNRNINLNWNWTPVNAYYFTDMFSDMKLGLR